MRSRPLRERGLFSVPVDEETRSVLLPFAEREGEFSFALPQAAIEAYESFTLPGQAMRGELGAPGSPEMVQGATRFGVDFGMLPALATGLLTPSPNTLRMGMGGADTVSGGARRGPEVDELGFYSKALETARMLPQEKGTGQQFRSMLTKAGVKEDELKFTPGLEGLLSQPKVTRDELVGLLEENRIRPEETLKVAVDGSSDTVQFSRQPELVSPEELGGGDYVLDEASRILDSIRTSQDFLYDDDLIDMMVNSGMEMPEAERVLSIYKKEGPGSDKLYSVDVEFVEDAASDLVRETYYSTPDYQVFQYDDLEGLGYRVEEDASGFNVFDPQGRIVNTRDISSIDEAEVVALDDARQAGLIGGEGDTLFMKHTEPGGSNYREMLLQVPEYEGMTDEFIATGHFDEPNIVVHARTKDRSSDSGTDDVLYVEELQSDWGQRGRDRGFRSEEDASKLDELRESFRVARDKRQEVQDESRALAKKALEDFAKSKGLELRTGSDGALSAYHNGQLAMLPGDIRNFMFRGEPVLISRHTPDGVFIKNETASALDDWPEYYAKAMEKLRKAKAESREAEVAYDEVARKLPAGPLVTKTKKFAEVGIKRLINQAAKEGKRYVTFSPGEVQADRWNEPGLRKFYDDIIPRVSKEVVKRLDKDAFVDFRYFEDATGDVSGDRFTIEITDKMREEALRGQPLFVAPAVPTGAGGLLGDDRRVETVEDFYRAGIL